MENLGFSFHLAGTLCFSAILLHIKTRNVFLKYLLLVRVEWRQPFSGKRLVHPISLVKGVFRIVGCGFKFPWQTRCAFQPLLCALHKI